MHLINFKAGIVISPLFSIGLLKNKKLTEIWAQLKIYRIALNKNRMN